MSQNKTDIAFLPLGYSREDNGGTSLSPIKNYGAECPKCGEGAIGYQISKSGTSWGRPSSPATAYCTECNTEFILGLQEKMSE